MNVEAQEGRRGTTSAAVLGGGFTSLSLAALVSAFVIGWWARGSSGSTVPELAGLLAPAAELWLLALRLAVVPLVVTQLLAAVLISTDHQSVGRLGLRTVGVMLPILITTGSLSLTAVAPATEWLTVDAARVEPVRRGVTSSPTTASPPTAATAGGARLIARLEALAGATSGILLWLIAAAVTLGVGLSQLPPPHRDLATRIAQRLAALPLRTVAGILFMTPLAVFALVLRLTYETAVEMWWALWFYVMLVCAWQMVVAAGLYPVAAVCGRTTLRRFARAVAPAQVVALGTRSSLMSLPALAEGGRKHLNFGPSATALVLPLCASIFKMSTVTVEPVRYLFLAHLFGVPITVASAATFLVTIVILSFSGVGIPGGGAGFDTLPAFVAAGIPAEGLVLVAAVDTLPDIAMTLINVTGYMCVATIVSRAERPAL